MIRAGLLRYGSRSRLEAADLAEFDRVNAQATQVLGTGAAAMFLSSCNRDRAAENAKQIGESGAGLVLRHLRFGSFRLVVKLSLCVAT